MLARQNAKTAVAFYFKNSKSEYVKYNFYTMVQLLEVGREEDNNFYLMKWDISFSTISS